VLSSPANQEGLGGDVTVGSLPLELGESWGSSCLACCYGSPASQAGKRWRKVPLSCVEDFSVKWGLGKWSRDISSAWVTWGHQDWGIRFFTESLSYHAPQFGESTVLCALWAWISPSRTGRHGSHCGTQAALITGAHTEHLISWCAASGLVGWKETTWKPRHLFTWHQFFSDLSGTLHHGNECLKKLLWFNRVSWYSWSFGAAERYFT
jgi:hypothetical protein